ncbi:MAG: putative porin [Gemmatimonadota bacterium]
MKRLPAIPRLACCGAVLLALTTPGAALAQEASQDSAPRWRLSGDFRLRGEVDRDRRSAPDRERARVRFRIAAEGELGAGIAVGARLVTAPDPDDPNSTHQTLGEAFRNPRVALDRVYVRWRPRIPQLLEIRAGKFPHVFAMPAVFGELVWDADVQPEGIAALFEPVPELRLAGGGYLLLHRGGGKDVNLGAAQAAVRLQPASRLRLDAAVGTYIYGTPDAGGARELGRQNQGNSLVTDAAGDTIAFASEFSIWNAHAALIYDGLPVPVAAAAEYVVNASAASGFDDDGFAVGGVVGRLGRPGQWRLAYRYQDFGREAIFSPVAQDDFLDAANFRGHLLGFAIQYLPFANAHVWTLWSARNEPREDEFQKRFRLDLNFSWRLQ